MANGNDDDRTRIGGAFPPPDGKPAQGGDRTVIGGALPGMGGQPASGWPPAGAPGWPAPGQAPGGQGASPGWPPAGATHPGTPQGGGWGATIPPGPVGQPSSRPVSDGWGTGATDSGWGTPQGAPGHGAGWPAQPAGQAPGSYAPPYPPQQPPYSPAGGAQGWGQPGWPSPAYPPHHAGGQSPFGDGPHASGYANPLAGIGQAASPDRGFFPDIAQPGPQVPRAHATRIPLSQALQVKPLDKGSSSNPLIAAAAPLLILLGRLRTGLVEMQVAPLMDHVTREIDVFERKAMALGVPQHEAMVGKYILSGTADDIVQNLPGADRSDWLQYSMVARFFHRRDSGVGFFQETEKAMQAPGQRFYMLELILACLSLGFEGQYRTLPNGAVELSRIRKAIYETLRRVHPRPDDDISVMWQPVELGGKRRFGLVSVPVVLGVAAAGLLAVFGTLTTLINRDGAAAAQTLLDLHPGGVNIAIERTGPAFVPEAPAQLERIRAAFATEIQDGVISVGLKGDYIYIRVGVLQLFDSGSDKTKPGFAEMARKITDVLNREGGPVLVQGFTDSVPLSGRGRFKNNIELSMSRAQAVKALLAQSIDRPERITAEGKGEADPVGDNSTPEGRAENRRVEVLLAREGTFATDTELPEGMTIAPAAAPAAPTDPATPQTTGASQ